MIVRAMSDQHGFLPEIEPCDLLLIAGDVCPIDNHQENHQRAWLCNEFSHWLKSIPAKQIIGIGGNHDFALQKYKGLGQELPWNYLCDSQITLNEFIIYGTPWVPALSGWAFYEDGRNWVDIIPDDVDILITHTPPAGVLDKTLYGYQHVASPTLTSALMYRITPKLHVFGHIHEAHGRLRQKATLFANVAVVDINYNLKYAPMEFEL